ncbi:hypothetical protein [Thermasporomyces composti]|uniref:Uncharacterized protein n=1 Tax=Thermasporomyces composti TaxID=696763 RepID=A0A3D9VFM4_THECX|nr:hypothetical protein [Thermasporomyces composti]REF37955.1 hypothetical protein DFJ64_3416 [Thermasporomyces composti]
MRRHAGTGLLGLLLVMALGSASLVGGETEAVAAKSTPRAHAPRAAAVGVSDQVRLGDPASEAAHRLRTSGATARTACHVEAGQITESYIARVVRRGGRFSVRLAVDRSRPLTLQVREVRPNETWGQPYGFRLLLDGIPHYVRDARIPDPGGGPYSSFFLDTADPEVLRDGVVVVTVEGTSAEPAYLTEIWAYTDLPAMVHDQGMRVPDRVIFVLGQDHRGEAYFRSRLDYVRDHVHESSDVGLGMAVLDYFPVRTKEQMRANYELWLRLSREYGLPFAIESTSDWEGTPSRIPDGKGGTFGDIRYQQILWSPQDRTGPDKDVYQGQRLDELLGDRYEPRYGLSVPNIWGSTPWLTWRDPDLNAYLEQKANESLELIRALAWDLQRQGEGDRLLDFSTTMESTYWSKRDGKGVADQAYTDYNDGVERRDLYADFNPSTVAAARADGVELDPTDGLSEAEKRWLYKNQSYPQQLFADIFYAGLPRERVEAGPDGVRYPTDMRRHNVHAEVYSRMQEPYWADTHPSSIQGVVQHARPGAEYITLDDYTKGGFAHLQRMREFGRIANPNLENSVSGYGPDKTLLLRQTYVNGSRYTSIYNWQETGPDAAAAWVNAFIDDMHPFDVDRSAPPNGRLPGLRTVTTTFTAGDVRLANHVDVRVERIGRPTPLRLTLSDDEGRIVAMRHLGAAEVPTSGWATFGIPVVALERGQDYTVTVEQVAGDGVPAYAFPTVDGDLALRVGLDMPTERDRSLVIQWRRDAADAIRHISADIGPDDTRSRDLLREAKARLTQGRYVEAYRLAMRADVLRYPVLYQVRATTSPAALKPFPVAVSPSVDVDVDVTAHHPGRSLTLTVRGYAAGTASVSLRGFGSNPTVVVDDVPVPTRVERGRVTFTVDLPDTSPRHVRVDRAPAAPR